MTEPGKYACGCVVLDDLKVKHCPKAQAIDDDNQEWEKKMDEHYEGNEFYPKEEN